MKSTKQGGQSNIYTIVEDENKLEKGGGHYSGCKPKKNSDYTSNEETDKRLWEVSQRLLNIKFEL